MNKRPPLDLSFSPDLSDEAAYEISEFLQALSLTFEEHYFGQNEANSSISHGKTIHFSR